MRSPWVLVVLVGTALTLGACGEGTGSDGGNGSADSWDAGSTDTATPEASQAPDRGCSGSHPNYLENTGRLAGLFQTCGSADGTSVTLTNVSSTVLVVTTGGSSSLSMSVSESEPSTFADAAVSEVEPGVCSSLAGPCGMPPRATVIARDVTPVSVVVDVDPASTARATAASAFGGWVAKKVQTRAGSYAGSITACADAVGNLSTQGMLVDQAMRQAVVAGGDCTSLVKQVAAEANQNPAPEQASDEVLRSAGSFTKNLRRDLYVYKAIRIVTAIR